MTFWTCLSINHETLLSIYYYLLKKRDLHNNTDLSSIINTSFLLQKKTRILFLLIEYHWSAQGIHQNRFHHLYISKYHKQISHSFSFIIHVPSKYFHIYAKKRLSSYTILLVKLNLFHLYIKKCYFINILYQTFFRQILIKFLIFIAIFYLIYFNMLKTILFTNISGFIAYDKCTFYIYSHNFLYIWFHIRAFYCSTSIYTI